MSSEQAPSSPETSWDFSEVPRVYLGEIPEEVIFDPRDHAHDYSLRIDQKVSEQLDSQYEPREVTLRKRLEELEARKKLLKYPKKAKPAIRERINKIRKELDEEIASVVKELMIYDAM